ncbi:MAG: hypothetical protein AB7I50_09510 [Vicinamibacterales bacterium]
MRRLFFAWLLIVACTVGVSEAQTRRRTTAKPAPAKPPALKTEPIEAKCPAVLGQGVSTMRTFCDVISSINPAEGIVMAIPPRTGAATLTFDLHNRHTYSESQVKEGKAYARYTATVVLANLKGEVLDRATVQSEFRSAATLYDRVGGGAGPGGVKAVAPVGVESVVFTVPDDVTEVVVLGERLTVQRPEGREVFSSAGRPIAIFSNPILEYRPKPVPPARKR